MDYGSDFNSFYELVAPTNKEVIPTKEKKEIRNNSSLICIEISASCDHSQKKQRINKYILGVLTPLLTKEAINSNLLPANSLRVIDYVSSDGSSKQIWLNLNYVVGLNPADGKLGNIVFGLKDEIVNQISNRYANHISRIGITSF